MQPKHIKYKSLQYTSYSKPQGYDEAILHTSSRYSSYACLLCICSLSVNSDSVTYKTNLTTRYLLDTFPSLVVDGATTSEWVNVRMTNNHYSRSPVTDVTSADFRCYDSEEPGTAQTISVAAGSQLGIMSDGTMYHPSVVNVYMAKAPSSVDGWTGDGAVWFKVYEISAVTDGGKSITFPAESKFDIFYYAQIPPFMILFCRSSWSHFHRS